MATPETDVSGGFQRAHACWFSSASPLDHPTLQREYESLLTLEGLQSAVSQFLHQLQLLRAGELELELVLFIRCASTVVCPVWVGCCNSQLVMELWREWGGDTVCHMSSCPDCAMCEECAPNGITSSCSFKVMTEVGPELCECGFNLSLPILHPDSCGVPKEAAPRLHWRPRRLLCSLCCWGSGVWQRWHAGCASPVLLQAPGTEGSVCLEAASVYAAPGDCLTKGESLRVSAAVVG